MINKSNYEIYALDYIENRLNGKLKEEFELFLSVNPDIREEIEAMRDKNTLLSELKENIIFKDKEELKKSEIEGLTYFEQLAIEDVEGIITEEKKKELLKIVTSSPEKFILWNELKRTKTEPDYKVTFEHKRILYKQQKGIGYYLYSAMRYAAIIVLLVGLFTLLKNEKYIFTKNKIGNFTYISQPAQIPNFPVIDKEPYNNKINKLNFVICSEKQKKVHVDTEVYDSNSEITFKDIQFSLISFHDSFYIDSLIRFASIYNYQDSIQVYQKQLVEEISQQALEKFQQWSEQRGIDVSSNRFIITIGNKNYGICVTK